MTNPTVSVITPVFNAGKWLPETLNSVHNQTFQGWEHILVDDLSTDGSVELIEAAMAQDARIRLVRLETNGGPAQARNRALEIARGRYIAFLDADDLWLNGKLEQCLQFMQDNQHPFVFHAFRYLSSDGKRVGSVVKGPRKLNLRTLHIRRGTGDCMSMVIDTNQITNFRFPKVGNQYLHEDWAAWLSIVRQGFTGHLLDRDLGRYRQSGASRNSSKLNAAMKTWRLYHEYEKLPWFTATTYWSLYAFNSLRLQLASKPRFREAA
jgi:teichuronic acid biosynthesis glycosyltransferase TuaG